VPPREEDADVVRALEREHAQLGRRRRSCARAPRAADDDLRLGGGEERLDRANVDARAAAT